MAEQKACPGCAGPLEFEPKIGKLYCPHCGDAGEEITADGIVRNEDFAKMLQSLEDNAETDEQLMVGCSGCGAEITLDANVVAGHCPYCASPVVASSHSTRRIRPAALLPFKLTRDEAVTLYNKWLSSRWFIPGSVKREAKLAPPTGIYLPHWLYNTIAVTQYAGARGEYYYVTVNYTTTENGKIVQKTREERRTRWYPTAGEVNSLFQNLLVTATTSLPEKQVEALTPWDLPALQPYSADYIRGFREESYSVSLSDGFASAEKKIKSSIDHTIRLHIGGDTQQVYSAQTQYRDMTFKHVLLPVWGGAFRYREKSYPIIINAQTGEVQGKRPYSAFKITALVLILAALFTAICYFVG